MKIVILDGAALNPGDLNWSPIQSIAETIIYDQTPTGLIEQRAKDADIILTNKVIINNDLIEKLKRLKLIAVTATGYNNINIASANKKGIIVCNAVGYSTFSVAQHTFSLLLELTNQCGKHNHSTKSGEWNENTGWSYAKTPLIELNNKTIGIVGFGKIGQKVAEIAKSFGLKVIAYHKHPDRDRMEGVSFVSLDKLLKESDVITLHCPLNDTNKEFINNKSLSLMKKNAFLINTARGPLINEADLADALKDGEIAGAAIDVMSEEPPKKNNPLISIDNIVITSHIAWATYESRNRLIKIVADNINAFLSGSPKNVVN